MTTMTADAPMLDLDRFFFDVRGSCYAIVKLREFPAYRPSGDVDVFAEDAEAFVRSLLRTGRSLVRGEVMIEVTERAEGGQIYVDFYRGPKLEFRFDVYRRLPAYQRVRLKPSLFDAVVADRREMTREWNGAKYPLYVPSPADDLLLRYVEYLEWYQQRPDKLAHLEFVLAAAREDGDLRAAFLVRLHQFTALPSPVLLRRGAARSLGSAADALRSSGRWIRAAGRALVLRHEGSQ